MNRCYVEEREEGFWISGTRVSLDSIVYAFHGGQTAESIAQMFPVLTLEQVYGAIAHYLAYRVKIDEYLTKARSDSERLSQTAREADPTFYQKMADARRQVQAVGR